MAAGCAPDEGSPDEQVAAAVASAVPRAKLVTTSVLDAAGRAQYLVTLDGRAAETLSAAPIEDARFPAWHKPQVGRLVRAVEREHGIVATSMRSYVETGFSAFLDDAQVAEIRGDRRVIAVARDSYNEFSAIWSDTTAGSEITSWGTHAVNNGLTAGSYPVYIVDTGLTTHTDLNVVRSVNPFGGATIAGCYPHSVHVAGIVGAKRNGDGSVGVAPNTPITSVTVLGDQPVDSVNHCLMGQNPTSTGINNALDWVMADLSTGGANAGKVGIVNMSMNGNNFGSYSPPSYGLTTPVMFKLATPSGTYKGAFIAQSAGNYDNTPLGQTACTYAYPIDYSTGQHVSSTADGIMVVGAINDSDQMVRRLNNENSFRNPLLGNSEIGSDYGRCVEAWAPGNNVYSTWNTSPGSPSKAHGYLSGTSMAAPHVSGLAALIMSSTPAKDARELETKVRATFVDLNATAEDGAEMFLPTFTGIPGKHSEPYSELSVSVSYPASATDTPNDAITTYPDLAVNIYMGSEGAASCDVYQRLGTSAPTLVHAAGATYSVPGRFYTTPGKWSIYSQSCPALTTTVTVVPHGVITWTQTAKSVTYAGANLAPSPSCKINGYLGTNPNNHLSGFPVTTNAAAGTFSLPPTSGTYTYSASCSDNGPNLAKSQIKVMK